MSKHYETAREIYAAWGVDTEEVLRRMDEIPVSINCWQLDDLTGFEDFDAALTGGIAATDDRIVDFILFYPHMVDSALGCHHAGFDIRTLQSRACGGGAGDHTFFAAKNHFSIGADIHQ